MARKTSYHSENGRFTGRTIVERSGDSSKVIQQKATGEGLLRDVLGPGWKTTSTTDIHSNGNSRTTRPK